MTAITSRAQARDRRAVRRRRARHRQHEGPGRAADRAHQPSHRAPARAAQRPPLPARPADARRTPPAVPGLPAAARPRGLPRADQGAWPAQVGEAGASPRARPAPVQARGARTARLHRAGPAGHTTILVFYPFAFSPVCTDQLQLYEERARRARRAAARTLYGVSCDCSYSQKAFKEKLGVGIQQLSDFEPKGAACTAFGVLHDGGFATARAGRHRPRRGRALELPGALAGRAARRRAAARGPRRGRDLPDRPSGPASAKLRPFGKEKKETDRRPTGGQEGSEYE